MCTPGIIDAITGGGAGGAFGDFLDSINQGPPILDPPPKANIPVVDPENPVINPIAGTGELADAVGDAYSDVVEGVEEGIIGGIYGGIGEDEESFDEAVEETVEVVTDAGSGTVPGGVTPTPATETEDEDEEDAIPELLLGKLASGRRTLGEGRGIGANILTSGSGVNAPARTRRRTLLG